MGIIKHCIKCGMPDSRPGTPFQNGKCQACINFERRKTIDWASRLEEFKKLCDKYRSSNSEYDCIIPVSGGKDSYFQVYTLKEEFHMNPLLVTIGDWFTKTKAGTHNLKNLINEFSCDHILYNISEPLFKKVGRIGFEDSINPLFYLETLISVIPFKLAIDMEIPLVIYGESEFEYGSWKEGSNTNEFIINKFKGINKQFWIDRGLTEKEMAGIKFPSLSPKQIPAVLVLSYFKPWSSTRNLIIAKRYGFMDLVDEWTREGYIENFEQIDSMGYMIHLWLKFPKFGFQRISDIASRRVREGGLTLMEAQKIIKENDYKIDQLALTDFNKCFGYSYKEFWAIVDRFWNEDIFEYRNNRWTMKPNFYEDFQYV